MSLKMYAPRLKVLNANSRIVTLMSWKYTKLTSFLPLKGFSSVHIFNYIYWGMHILLCYHFGLMGQI